MHTHVTKGMYTYKYCMVTHRVEPSLSSPESKPGWHEGTLEERGVVRIDAHHLYLWVQRETDGMAEVEEGGTGGEHGT